MALSAIFRILWPHTQSKYGCDMSSKVFIEGAWKLADRHALFLTERNTKNRVARDTGRTGKGASSSDKGIDNRAH
jgi:hypothetical protein